MTHVVCQPCYDCKYTDCVVVCPVECFYEGERMLYIHPDECIDCGACEPVCPVDAVFYDADLPPKWSAFLTVNREVFAGVGSPGGAGQLAAPLADHPSVGAMAPAS